MSSVGSLKKRGGRKLTSIDDLPIDVVQRILNCLPLREAIRTSVLAKHWRYKWESLSRLKFDAVLYNSFSWERNYGHVRKYLKMVNNVLFSLTGPIHELHIYLPYEYQRGWKNRIKYWIQLAAGRGVKDLALICRRHFEVPVALFSCLELTHLSIYFFSINPPLSFKGFPHLVSLKLGNIFSDHDNARIEDLISGCPELRMLDFRAINRDIQVDPDPYFCVSAPKLERLVFSYSSGFNVRLGATTKIKTAKLDVYYNPISSYMIELLSSLCNAEKLDLSFKLRNFLYPRGDIPCRLPLLLPCLKILKLECGRSFFALCLIRSSPNLQQLEIAVYSGCELQRDDDALDFIEDCRLEQLRYVKLGWILDSSDDSNLVKFLLACFALDSLKFSACFC